MTVEYGEFPEINGRDLNKRDKVVPDDFVDKNLIIIVAFQQWHQPLVDESISCLLYTSPSPRDVEESRMPSSA